MPDDLVRHRGFVHSTDVTCPKCGSEESFLTSDKWWVSCTACGKVLLGGERMPDMAHVVREVRYIMLTCECGNVQTWLERTDRVAPDA